MLNFMLNSLDAIQRPRDVNFPARSVLPRRQEGAINQGVTNQLGQSDSLRPTNSTHQGCIKMRSRRASPRN
ncbi:hypothetical protein BKA56DRAFT_596677 [Ilyonectria sp. MPI-CAGE-AT-0026]|nr:hypothetical protein BKA56DRAFT_596677 [Ilyonectria sp. MPI-CAGE-AT-0026]